MEVTLLQSFLDPILLVYGIGPVIVGIIAGFPLGSIEKLQSIERVLLAILVGGSIGVIFSLAVAPFVPATSISYILAVLVSTGGTMMGMALNWNPAKPRGSKHHIIYEPDDEDAFDREIEEALKGKHE